MLKTQKIMDNEIDEILTGLKKFPPSVNEVFSREGLEAYSEEYADGDFMEALLNLAKDKSIVKKIHHLETLLRNRKDADFFSGHFLETLMEAPYNWKTFYSKTPTEKDSKKIAKKLGAHFDAIIKIISDNKFIYEDEYKKEPVIPLLKKIHEELYISLDPYSSEDTLRIPRKRRDHKVDITFTSNILAYITDSYLKNPCYDIIADCLYTRFGERCEGITGDHVRKNYKSTYTTEWKNIFTAAYAKKI